MDRILDQFPHWVVSDTMLQDDTRSRLIIDQWKTKVAANETVLHLGNLLQHDRHQALLAGLPGRKLLLRGQKDRHDRSWYARAGFEIINEPHVIAFLGNWRIILSSKPDMNLALADCTLVVHGHEHEPSLLPHLINVTGHDGVQDLMRLIVQHMADMS